MALGRRTFVLICNLWGQMVGQFFVSVGTCWAVLLVKHDTGTHEKYGAGLCRVGGGVGSVAGICRLCGGGHV